MPQGHHSRELTPAPEAKGREMLTECGKCTCTGRGQASRSCSLEFKTCSQPPIAVRDPSPLLPPSRLLLVSPIGQSQLEARDQMLTDAFHTGQPPRALRKGERQIEDNPAQRRPKKSRLVSSALREWTSICRQNSYKHLVTGSCGCRIMDSFHLPQIMGSSL